MARKRSRSEDMILVPLDRRQRLRVRIYTSLVVLLLIVGSFVAGQVSVRENVDQLRTERRDFAAQSAELEQALQAARNELALHRTGSEVAQQAQEQVRGEIRDLRGQLAELEEAVAFYKSVMAPGSVEQGLRIERLDLAPANSDGEVAFRLVLTQVGDNRSNIAGDVLFRVTGYRRPAGEIATEEVNAASAPVEVIEVSGSDILQSGSETRFRFRYFQELTGKLRLPADIEAEHITIEAISGSRRDQKTERTYPWQLQERSGAWAG